MLNLANIPEHIKEWAESDLLPHLQAAEDKLTELRGVAEASAQMLLSAAQRELARVQAEAPALGEKATELIAAAEKGVAEAEALLAKLEGGTPSGM